ncbi:hypothetical protein EZS27_015237 [termite gut metagenome]|uniref:Uncharacterized protein n=1 Tax=termite gut metagenome TaxID=433724 RepID=A0A5J4RRI2_9ZZZZ
MDIENVGNGTFHNTGKFKEKNMNKSKRGRKSKACKQEYRYIVASIRRITTNSCFCFGYRE